MTINMNANVTAGPRFGALLAAVRLGYLGALLVTVTVTARGAEGVVYYNRISTANTPAALRRVNADGNGDQAVPVDLPSAIYPTVGRDGRRLLLTSPDPGRPYKISNNVFVQDLPTGALGRITGFQDVVTTKGVLLTNDLGQPAGNRDISGYTINFPYHKAFSPDGSRVAVMNLRKTGSVTLQTPLDPGRSTELTAGSGRVPVVEIYRVADGMPEGSYVFLGIERDGFNQGGDGLDWHPARNEIVVTVASDIPAGGTAGTTGMEGTLLAVFTASGPSQFLRKLTNPAGRVDAYYDLTTLVYTSAGPHDYAPAISPDGQRVAFVRHTLRQDNRLGLAPLPAQCALRIVNYDGTDDHEVLRLSDGLWVTRVAWSPDGSQIAFDLAPQLVLNGWNSLLGDVTRSEIDVVNADGTQPRLLAAAPAAFPTWAPGPPSRPTASVVRRGNGLEMRIDPLVPGRAFQVEGTTDLRNWTSLLNSTATDRAQTITITPDPRSPAAFYRVAVP